MGKTDATDRWDSLLGYAWAEMLRGQRLSLTGTVVEIGPGFTDKIARGLAALDFRGTLILVEPNEEAGAWALERYRRLLTKAEVLLVQRAVFDCKIPQARSAEALLSNHIFDDLILNAALPPQVSARIFSQMQPGAPCSRMFIRRWRELLSSPEPLGLLITQVAEDFTKYVAEMQPRLVLLNQYPSWRHNQRGLGSIHTQALRLMQLLEAGLAAARADYPAHLSSGSQDSVRWLVGKPSHDTPGCCVKALEERAGERDFRL